jgi:hypothetical protein
MNSEYMTARRVNMRHFSRSVWLLFRSNLRPGHCEWEIHFRNSPLFEWNIQRDQYQDWDFGLFTAASTKLTTTSFWDSAQCSLVEVGRRFRGAHWIHHHPDDTGSTSETSVNFYETTRRNFLRSYHLLNTIPSTSLTSHRILLHITKFLVPSNALFLIVELPHISKRNSCFSNLQV